MNTTRECGCKGHRSCLKCETEYNIKPIQQLKGVDRVEYFKLNEDNRDLEELGFHGIHIIPDFITEAEESQLIQDLDKLPWDKSQSGRRKQNFGPKANFKKRKAKLGNFHGFPHSTEFIQERFKEVPLLAGYRTVEQCSIEYSPETGACIEPHIDDCWIWGERIVQLNLLSSTYLSLVPYRGDLNRYNLKDVESYPRVVKNQEVVFNPFEDATTKSTLNESTHFPVEMTKEDIPEVMVKVPLPPRSLLVMYGKARYNWEHMILREDISTRRAIIAYREFTPFYLPGGQSQEIGAEILKEAENFWIVEETNKE